MSYPDFRESETVKHGWNAEHPERRDDGYVICSNCGFTCHLDRDQRGPDGSRMGDGIVIGDNVTYDDTAYAYDQASEPAVAYDGYCINDRLTTAPSGCPLCGCNRYDQFLDKDTGTF